MGERYDRSNGIQTDNERRGCLQAGRDDRSVSAWAGCVIPDGHKAAHGNTLTWDGDLGSSMEQIDRIKQELHLLTGLLNFLQAPDAPMSGVALRLMNVPLYASTKAVMRNVQNRATDALRALQTIQGAAPTATVAWEHPFDVLEGASEGGMVDEDDDPDETEDEEAEEEEQFET